MINFLVGSLLSFCLLSPVQSPDCAGGVGVSVPAIPAPLSSAPPVVVQLPAPLPLPPLPVAPVQITSPPLPAPLPVPQPVQPVPDPAPVQLPPAPVPAPASVLPAPEPTADVPIQAQTPTTAATPEPTYDALATLKSVGPEVDATPLPASTSDSQRPGWLDGPFDDGSLGAAIGTTILQFPDYVLLLVILCGISIAVLTEKLDGNPKVEDQSDLFD